MRYSQVLVFKNSNNTLGDRRHVVQGIEYLNKNKAGVTLVNRNGNRTALHQLCANGIAASSFDMVKLFVTSGASLYSIDRFGVTPFELLFVASVDPAPNAKAFLRSADFHPIDVFRFIVSGDSDHLNDHLSIQTTPLNFALKKRDITAPFLVHLHKIHILQPCS